MDFQIGTVDRRTPHAAENELFEQLVHVEQDRQHVVRPASQVRHLIQQDQRRDADRRKVAFRVPVVVKPIEVLWPHRSIGDPFKVQQSLPRDERRYAQEIPSLGSSLQMV